MVQVMRHIDVFVISPARQKAGEPRLPISTGRGILAIGRRSFPCQISRHGPGPKLSQIDERRSSERGRRTICDTILAKLPLALL